MMLPHKLIATLPTVVREFGSYVMTRCGVPIVLLSLLLTLTAVQGSNDWTVATAVQDGNDWTIANAGLAFVLAYLLVFQFRLWDDLVSLPEDRVGFPDRVLCRTHSVRSFYVVLVLSVLLNLAACIVLGNQIALGVLLALDAVFLGGYATRLFQTRTFPGVLLKYPCIVWLVNSVCASARSSVSPWRLALLYFTFVLYELLHDVRWRQAGWLPSVRLLLLVLLIGLAAGMLFLSGASATVSGLTLYGFVTGAFILLWTAGLPPPRTTLVFGAHLIWTLSDLLK